jgi:hypothetical protein
VESWCGPEKTAQFLVKPINEGRETFILLKARLRRPQSIALAENRFGGLPVTGGDDPAKKLRPEGYRSVPGSCGWHEEESDVAYEPRGKRRGALVGEDIANRVVIMEIAKRLNFERRPVKTSREGHLASEFPRRVGSGGQHSAVDRIPPLHDSPVVAKPVNVLSWLIALEADNRRDQANAISGLRVAPEEIMLSELANHPISTEQKRQGLNDCRFPAVIWPNKYCMGREANYAFFDAAKIFDFQFCDLHDAPSVIHRIRLCDQLLR